MVRPSSCSLIAAGIVAALLSIFPSSVQAVPTDDRSAAQRDSSLNHRNPMKLTKKSNRPCAWKRNTYREKLNIKVKPGTRQTGWVYEYATRSASGRERTAVAIKNRVRRTDRFVSCHYKSARSKKGKIWTVYLPDRWAHKIRYTNFVCENSSCKYVYTKKTAWMNCHLYYWNEPKNGKLHRVKTCKL